VDNPEVKIVEALIATKGDISQNIRLIGTIKAKKQTALIAKKEGSVEYLAPIGQMLKKTEVIARLENADLKHHFELAQEAERLAKTQYERVLSLAKTNAISKQMVEEKKNLLIEAQKVLSIAKIELGKTQFIAAFDGIVGISKFSVGAQVQSGDIILTFYDPHQLKVEFDIPAVYFSQIKNGQPVVINGQPLQLTNIQKMIDPQTNMLQTQVDFSCEDCVIGDTVDVELTITKSNDVIVLPSSCVFLKNGKNLVYLVKENKAVVSPVGLGIREKDKIEITWGVEQGDVVITQNQNRLYPDIAVKVHHPDSNTKIEST
jgi:membrane fusion protein (multidrug efflux system)